MDLPDPPWKSNTLFDEVIRGVGFPMGSGNSKVVRDMVTSLDFSVVLEFQGGMGNPRRFGISKTSLIFQGGVPKARWKSGVSLASQLK